MIVACIMGLYPTLQAQEEAKEDTVCMKFTLGEVVIRTDKIEQIGTVTTAESIDQTEKENIAEALNLIPGVVNAQGAKEDMIYVRGFNLRQVPVYLDGIPIALPYDGFFDLDMMLANSVSEISVVSGTDAILYGPNALGGAINIISSRPENGLSGYVKAGTFTNGKYNAATSIGYATQKFYTLMTFSSIQRNNYRLSDDYEPLSSLEDGGDLDNSYKKNCQLDAKFVYTPSEGNEYAVAYVGNWGEKGIPPYLGTNGTARFWQFPQYDKYSIYFLSKTQFSDNTSLKTRLYYDKFDDNLKSFDDSTYSTMHKKYAFSSYYDDYNLGGIATCSFVQNGNSFNADFQYRQENHKEFNEGEPAIEMADQSLTLSLVDNYYIRSWVISGGVSVQNMRSIKAEFISEDAVRTNFPDNSTTTYNGELGVQFLGKSGNVRLGVAYKTRFPTMKDRYSQRFGRSLPNPDLKEEYALNYSLGYEGNITKKLVVNAGVYISSLEDAISEVYGIDSSNPSVYQLQNTAKAEYYSADVSIAYSIFKSLTLQTNYAYAERKNISSPDVVFTYVPAHTFQGAAVYRFRKYSYVNLNFENYSSRYVTSDGRKIDGYALLNIKGALAVLKDDVVLEAGINNIFDKDYQISEGYPMPGRSMFVSATYRF